MVHLTPFKDLGYDQLAEHVKQIDGTPYSAIPLSIKNRLNQPSVQF